MILSKECLLDFKVKEISATSIIKQNKQNISSVECTHVKAFHGAMEAVGGTVVGAVLIARFHASPGHPTHCAKDFGYQWVDDVFIVQPKCSGVYKVCFEKPTTTTPTATDSTSTSTTTTPHPG